MIVLSPGVPPDIQPLKKAMETGIRIIGELELAYQIATSGKWHTASGKPAKFLAITGTNGKSTTTTLLNEMLIKGGFRTILGGNIGNALTEEIYSRFTANGSQFTGINYIVVEVSSFQLEAI